MKLPFVLPFWWFAILFGMDKPPYPPHREESAYQDMPLGHHHKRLSKHIEGQVGDVKIDITSNETLSKSTDTDDSNKSGHSTKFVAIVTSATALVTALIGAGVSLAVRFAECKNKA